MKKTVQRNVRRYGSILAGMVLIVLSTAVAKEEVRDKPIQEAVLLAAVNNQRATYPISLPMGAEYRAQDRTPPTATTEEQVQHIMDLARTDHIALLEWAVGNYEKNVHDYTATLVKQERIKGKLKPQQTISVWFKEAPFSLVMKWRENAGSIDKLLYVEGQHKNQMIVHPTGIFSWLRSVKRDPRCKDARKATLRTCDQFGLHRSMNSLLQVYRQAQKKGDLQMHYLGLFEVGRRPCVRLERHLPDRKEYPSVRMVMDFDLGYLAPVSVTSYDAKGRLLSRYRYANLKFNNGISLAYFNPRLHNL